MSVFSLDRRDPAELRQQAFAWFCDISSFDNQHITRRCLELLSDHEHVRYARFRSKHDAHSYLISHALLRETLSSFFDIEAAEWRFEISNSGKPFISPWHDLPDLNFNLSHTQLGCAVIVSNDMLCGIDIEQSGRRLDCMAVARRMFNENELAQLETSRNRPNDFLRLWTAREAVSKATGRGLANSRQEFHLKLGNDDIQHRYVDAHLEIHPPDSQWHWHITSLQPLHNHLACAAIATTSSEIPTLGVSVLG